jgi:signal peptidase I
MTRTHKILIAVLVALVAANLFRAFVMEGFIVRGDSMDPTIASGTYVFVNKFAYTFSSPKRGDIIVVVPRDIKTKIIKRIIGLPGERLAIEGGHVVIRATRKDVGEPLAEAYIKTDSTPEAGFTHTTLDPGEYFAMGDNREVSIDSRELGPVDSWDIQGRVFGVLDLNTLSFKLF